MARPDLIDLRRAVYFSDLVDSAVRSAVGSIPIDELKEWRERYAAYPALFDERLQILDKDVRHWLSRPGFDEPASQGPGPVSTDLFPFLSKAIDHPPASLSNIDALPFSLLWLPLVGYAAKQVFGRVSARVIGDSAREQLSYHLLKEICDTAAPSVYTLFDRARSRDISLKGFVDSVLAEGYASVLDSYPALGRCIDTLLEQWIEQTALFCDRLNGDRERIESILGRSPLSLEVTKISCGLSDRHAGTYGMLIEFSSGSKVLYKPKNMTLERQLLAVNDWLGSTGSDLRFRFPACNGGTDYGWAEFVEQEDCQTTAEVETFFYKSGALLCLAYVLNATDLQYENLIASRADPVLVDLETFFYPEVRPFVINRHPENSSVSIPRIERSILGIGFLTFWDNGGAHTNCDFSAISGTGGQPNLFKTLKWIGVNADEMRPAYEQNRTKPGKNQVYLRGQLQSANAFAGAIKRGFSDFFKLVLDHKQSFSRFLDGFQGADSRLLFRPSRVYGLVLERSLLPENLKSAFKRNVSVDEFYRLALKGGYMSETLRTILDAEVSDLLRMNVPRFYIPVGDRRGLPDFADLQWESPMETVRKKIENLSVRSLSFHEEVIQEAICRRPEKVELPLNAPRLKRFVTDSLDALYSQANECAEGHIWKLPSFWQGECPIGERLGLYSGDLGTLLLLAAADRENGTTRSFPLLNKFKSRVSSLEGSFLDTIGIGHGTGSLIYGALLLSQLTHDEDWVEQSARLAATLSVDAIRYHLEPDLLSGQAGLLLALTRLVEVTDSKEFLSKAQVCLAALIDRFSTDEGWKRPNGDSSPGFAHGSAGVAFSAASFAKLSGDETAVRLTRKALEFDRKFYSEVDHNWPVLAKAESPWMVAWCNGRPGILLARLAANQILEDSRLAEEIDTCLEHFSVPAQLDFWCCGRSGAAEILHDCGLALGKQEYVAAAKHIVDEILERAYRTCFFRFSTDFAENYCFQPSLFRGLAGIAYSALRSVAPEKYPSLIAFDLVR